MFSLRWNQKKFNILVAMVLAASLFLGAAGGLLGGLVASNLFVRQGLTPASLTKNNAATAEELKILDTENSVISAVARVSPAVVSIVVTKEVASISQLSGPNIFPFDDWFDFPFEVNTPLPKESESKRQVGSGTGFIVSSNGYIITNKHVVSDENAEYTVYLAAGQSFVAKVVDKDPFNDLAVIKIEADNLPAIILGDSSKIVIGQSVIAIGNSLGEFRNTVTKGVVSGINRRVIAGDYSGASEVIEEAIQTDAAINPGNSGGPLVNLAGEVIGVNTAISQAGQLIGFAIPINSVKRIIESVEKNGRIVRPWLGVRYILNDNELAKRYEFDFNYGAIIMPGDTELDLAVIPGSPADKAGLKARDIILEVNGRRIDENNTLSKAISQFFPGDKIELLIWRDGQNKIVQVLVEEFSNL